MKARKPKPDILTAPTVREFCRMFCITPELHAAPRPRAVRSKMAAVGAHDANRRLRGLDRKELKRPSLPAIVSSSPDWNCWARAVIKGSPRRDTGRPCAAARPPKAVAAHISENAGLIGVAIFAALQALEWRPN
jgi:hypothetical protein